MQLGNFELLWKTSFQLIYNLLSLIMFKLCPETVVCFIIFAFAFNYMEAHTMNPD